MTSSSGLSESDAKHAAELLSIFSESDLKELVHTSTSGLMSCKNKEDSIATIVHYSKDARSLLSRKKITKNMLFLYLHKKGIQLASNFDKHSLVEATLKLWAQQDSTQEISQRATLSSTDELTSELSIKFASWFYERVNESARVVGNDTLMASDFWNDAQTTVRLVSDGASNDFYYSATNDIDSVGLFENLGKEHDLVYSPNLTEDGVRGVSEPHGAVMLMACGTLHQRGGNCVGVFEQQFLIIKDPVSQNWRIKKTVLNLTSKMKVESVPMISLTE